MQTIVALLLLASSPDASGSAAETPPPTGATAKPEKVKKICRAGASTGSRMTNKICKTQSEWDAQEGENVGRVKRDSGAGY